MRQLYPLLWVATLALAAVILLRPGGLGTILALAAQWENAPWSENYVPPWTRPPTTPTPDGPQGPRAGSRPAAWPQAAPSDQDWRRPTPVADTSNAGRSPFNPLRHEAIGPDDPPAADFVTQPSSQEKVSPNSFPPDAVPNVPEDRRTVLDWRGLGGPTERSGSHDRLTRAVESPGQSEAIPCEGAEILGRVGSEVILAKEVSWGIPELRAQNKDAPQELLEAKIREILKQRVAQKIEERLIVQDAQRTIPKDNFPKIRENVAREFEASQIPRLMKATGARTREELDRLLEASGSSIEMQKNQFVDAVIANEWLRHQMKIDEEVGHQEMLDYYHQHLSEFETPARARWEQLMVRVARFPSREDAYAALAQMGNQVLDGVPFAEVARAQSHGSTARDGGRWDWTNQGSLASELLNRVIFGDGVRPGIPVGALSPILEEEHALHIIRVIEREPPRRTPFEQAQVEIKKKIRAEREQKAKQAYLAKLRQQTPVWTAFDEATTASPSPRSNGWLR